jgi:hypothetical protein
MTSTQAAYDQEQTTQLLQLYASGVSLEALSEIFGRSPRSLISKLVREGVYQAEPRPAARLRKQQMLREICLHLNLDSSGLASLEKGTHEDLSRLYHAVCVHRERRETQPVSGTQAAA